MLSGHETDRRLTRRSGRVHLAGHFRIAVWRWHHASRIVLRALTGRCRIVHIALRRIVAGRRWQATVRRLVGSECRWICVRICGCHLSVCVSCSSGKKGVLIDKNIWICVKSNGEKSRQYLANAADRRASASDRKDSAWCPGERSVMAPADEHRSD